MSGTDPRQSSVSAKSIPPLRETTAKRKVRLSRAEYARRDAAALALDAEIRVGIAAYQSEHLCWKCGQVPTDKPTRACGFCGGMVKDEA